MERGLLAETRTDQDLVRVVRALRAGGYTRLDAFAPYVVPELEEALELGRPRLTWLIGAIAFAAAGLGYALQFLSNARWYPLDVGGRAAHAVPAFIIIAFETGILIGATAAFVLLLRSCGLPRLAHPLFSVPGFRRSSIDCFFVGVDARDPQFDRARTSADLERLDVVRVELVGAWS